MQGGWGLLIGPHSSTLRLSSLSGLVACDFTLMARRPFSAAYTTSPHIPAMQPPFQLSSQGYSRCSMRRISSWTCPSCHLGHTLIPRSTVVHPWWYTCKTGSFSPFLFAFNYSWHLRMFICFVRCPLFPLHVFFSVPCAARARGVSFAHLLYVLDLVYTPLIHCPPHAIPTACTRSNIRIILDVVDRVYSDDLAQDFLP
jgi:hypothetical protein